MASFALLSVLSRDSRLACTASYLADSLSILGVVQGLGSFSFETE